MSHAFPDEVVLAELPDGEHSRIHAPFRFVHGSRTTWVPAGWVTDFASIPWWARWLIHTRGRHSRAAVTHDWLYRVHDRPKDQADLAFYQGMASCKVPLWRRWVMWKAVSLFGKSSWESHYGKHHRDALALAAALEKAQRKDGTY